MVVVDVAGLEVVVLVAVVLVVMAAPFGLRR